MSVDPVSLESRTPRSAPKVSVIIPFCNSETTIGTTLDSLTLQTMPHWEAILIDDVSTDSSVEIVRDRAESNPRLRLIHAPRKLGPAGARNLGIEAARARYIAFLDSDDLWYPHKLSSQLRVLEAGAPIVFAAYEQVDTHGRVSRRVLARDHVTYDDLLDGNPIGCLTAVWDRKYFGHPLMPLVPMHEDYAFWLTLLRGGGYAIGLPDVLAQYRVSPKSFSGRKWRAAYAVWTILRAEPDLTFVRAMRGFVRYTTSSFLRRL